MKKLLSITVRGTTGRQFSFDFYGDPKYLPEWRAEGFEIDEIVNTIPVWVVDMGLTHAWCFLQDLFHFKNPWRE